MVITVMWMHSWTVVIISSCVLAILGALLICCICWETKKKSFKQFYILDENGIKNVTSNGGGNTIQAEENTSSFFRHLSSGSFKLNLNFFNNSPKIMPSNERKKYNSRCDLTQSMEITDAFDHCVLRFEGNDNNLVLDSVIANTDKEEDVHSCISNDSRRTFYSTYHMARTVSVADTIRSALSHSDLNNCIN